MEKGRNEGDGREEGKEGGKERGKDFVRSSSLSTEQLRTVVCITFLYAIAHDRIL